MEHPVPMLKGKEIEKAIKRYRDGRSNGGEWDMQKGHEQKERNRRNEDWRELER